MAQFHAMLITLAVGVMIGTSVRPGVLEVAIAAAAIFGAAAIYRRLGGRSIQELRQAG